MIRAVRAMWALIWSPEVADGLAWVDEHSSSAVMIERMVVPCKGCKRGMLLGIDVRCVRCGY